MRFVVGVDAEGLACVVGEPGKSLTASKDFEFAKKQAVREANAAARGLFAAGAETVVIWDNHGGSPNMDYHEIDERCHILCGRGDKRRLSVLRDGFAGILLVGYHAMEGTIDAILAHSFSSVTYQWMRVNGREVGEMAIDAAIAGSFGVPVILVASDEAGCREAGELFPWAHLVETKRGLARNMALSKSPRRVEREIEEAAHAAAEHLSSMKPFTFSSPIRYEVRYQRADAAEAKSRTDSRFHRSDAFTVAADGESIAEFY